MRIIIGGVALTCLVLAACTDDPPQVPTKSAFVEETVPPALDANQIDGEQAASPPFPAKSAVLEVVLPSLTKNATPVPTQPTVTEDPPALPFMIENPRAYSQNHDRGGRFQIRHGDVIFRLKEDSIGSYRLEVFLSDVPRYTGFCLDRMTNQDGETRLRLVEAIWGSEYQIEFFADGECQELLGQYSFTPERLVMTTDPRYPSPRPTSKPTPTEDLAEPSSSEESPEPPVVKLDPGQGRSFPLPLAVFENLPDDVALIYREGSTCYEGCPVYLPVYRIYREEGELVRDELFTRASPPFATLEPAPRGRWLEDKWVPDPDPNSEQIDVLAVPDGSRIVMTLCQGVECFVHGMAGTGSYDPEPPFPETDLYESTDGGVTWNHIDTLERPWNLIAISRSQLLLGGYNNVVPTWYGNMLWPNMDLEVARSYPEYPGPEDRRKRIEAVEGSGRKEALYLPGILPITLILYQQTLADYLKDYELLKYQPTIYPIAVQQGPFLRVIDVGDNCLPLRSEPSPDAEELACVAEHVLLQDQDEAVKMNGVTWLKAKTPAGVVGWADGRYLE